MALQLGLRSSMSLATRARTTGIQSTFGGGVSSQMMRWKSSDVGDVIGIDLGTTNSCVAIMVSMQYCMFAYDAKIGRNIYIARYLF